MNAINIETNQFENAHGCKPRGFGQWIFTFQFTSRLSGLAMERSVSYTGTYGKTAREARKLAAGLPTPVRVILGS